MAGRRLFRVAAVAAAVTMMATGVAQASTYHPAQTGGATPFDDPNVFCTKGPVAPGNRNSSSPGVTPNSITIADMSLDVVQLKKVGSDQMDFHQAMETFWGIVNNKCGGINGRKIILKTALYNVLAPDLVGHQQSQCLRITEDFKAFMTHGIVSQFPMRCMSIQHKTISLASAYVTSQEFADSKGRIVSYYPAGDKLAAAFVKDGVVQGTFKGHKITVLASTYPSASAPGEQKEQYFDTLKAAGFNVEFEVLPCVGTVCTQNLGNAVRKMKGNDTDLIVLSHYVPPSAVGPIFAEMAKQNLRAAVTGPDTDGQNGDSNMAQVVRTGGTDGVAWAVKYGWNTVGTEVRGGWRTGQIKESSFSKMCTQTLANALNQRRYNFDATDINNARWQGTTNICGQVRQVARAIYSLGNNVTTERMVAALRNMRVFDRRDSSPYLRDRMVYSGNDVSPASATDMRFNFPCPLPTFSSSTACMLPTDRPARLRRV